MDGFRAPLFAVACSMLSAMSAEPSGLPRQLAADFLAASGDAPVLLVGERHGDPRGHAFFAQIVALLAEGGERILVGLEVPADRGEDLRTALAGGGSPAFPVVDGPSYRGLLAFLGRLDGRAVTVEAVDAGAKDESPRDAVMARRVGEAFRSGNYDRIAVLVGNAHALKEIPWAFGSEDRSGREKLAGRLGAEGVPAASVVQWFPEGCTVPRGSVYHVAGSPDADAAVEALWGILNTAPSPSASRAAAVEGAVLWGCPPPGAPGG